MPAFEPSTWAEVSEATVSGKALVENHDSFVTHVRAFTDAPERFLISAPSAVSVPFCSSRRVSLTSEVLLEEEPCFDKGDPPNKLPRAHLGAVKWHEGLVDDVLGLGRVDVETPTLIKKGRTSNVDELCLTVASGNDTKYAASTINPSGTAFDPMSYLAQIHRTTSLAELREGKIFISQLCARLRDDADHFREEKYPSAALVEAELERTKRSLEHVSPFAKGRRARDTEEVFEKAENVLKARYEAVLARETKLTSLRRTLGVYTRYQWVFGLGARLRSCAADGVAAMESASMEYSRALKWLEAQDGADLSLIRADIANGFASLTDSLLNRLSAGHSSRQDTAKLVSILTSVNREDLVTAALTKRMNYAAEGLRKASQSMGISSVQDVQGTGSKRRDITDLISRSSVAFFDGLAHVWRLGRALICHERWVKLVHSHLLSLCQAYVDILRNELLSSGSLISKDAVRGIAAVRRRALIEIQVPEAVLQPIAEASRDITGSFLSSISKSAEQAAEKIAMKVSETKSAGADIAMQFHTILSEAMGQVDSTLVDERNLENDDRYEDDFRVEENALGENEHIEAEPVARNTSFTVTMLGKTCAELPAKFVEDVYKRLSDNQMEVDGSCLRMAVFCADMRSKVTADLAAKMLLDSPFNCHTCRACLAESNVTIKEIEEKCTKAYVNFVSKPLKSLAAGLVSFPEEELEESISRAVQIKIEGISKGANEVTLQLALITIATRGESNNTDLVRTILVSLIKTIGDTLVQALGTNKLIYHRAAQLWVDVTYIQDMITRGADGETTGLEEALDGYSRIKEQAVQAVLADGYSFSIGDMSVLRQTVVTVGMLNAGMVQDCFRETWALVRKSDTDEESV
eukprot:GFKZ01002153.1.p1 GENE.GFKZ01002153.1~~GFKZ01002153.1.p1  ORF type:complete len:885 (-),score=119.56 GFKZ01002153.1:2230-4824(-)